jgi:hypothetical protein
LRAEVLFTSEVARNDEAASGCPPSADSIFSQLKEDDVTAVWKKSSQLRAV